MVAGVGFILVFFATQLQKLKLMVAKSLRSPLKICGATHIFLTLLQIPLNKLSANKLKKEQRTVVPFLIGCTSANLIELFSYKWSIGVILSL